MNEFSISSTPTARSGLRLAFEAADVDLGLLLAAYIARYRLAREAASRWSDRWTKQFGHILSVRTRQWKLG